MHGYFENYASDENLPHEHWFWDRAKSGGIFIEHGVHFFDLFAGWLGPGTVVAAQRGIRPGSSPPLEEHVHCTVRYGPTTLVNFYHGFHQAGRMDRQELRLVFEWGDVTLYDWVPTHVRIHAIVDEAQTRSLCDLFPGARLDVSAVYSPKDRACHGAGNPLDVYQTIELSWGEGTNKSHRYGELLRAVHGRPDRLDSRPFAHEKDHGGERSRFAGGGLCRGSPGQILIDVRLHGKEPLSALETPFRAVAALAPLISSRCAMISELSECSIPARSWSMVKSY